jgi:hypothetical protein
MASDMQVRDMDEQQTIVGQERPPMEETLPSVSEARESRQEGMSAAVPSATPPVPPRHLLTAHRRQLPPAGRWALGIGLVVLGALSWLVLGFIVASAPNVFYALLVAALPAVTCLAAAWLVRSWWGLVAAAGVYVAAAALIWLFAVSTSLSAEFVGYIVLPALVMSAIGTAIGMLIARRSAHFE